MGKLFVITREDMPVPYQGVQMGHAVAQWLLDNAAQGWNNGTLVYCSVSDKDRLEMLNRKLVSRNCKPSVFNEPDLNNEITAIACYTDGNIFSNLKLWGQ